MMGMKRNRQGKEKIHIYSTKKSRDTVPCPPAPPALPLAEDVEIVRWRGFVGGVPYTFKKKKSK
jgi:hypothetical protein